MSLNVKVLKQLRAMVQRNDHGSAYQLAAKALGCADLESRFAAINRRCEELGEVPLDVYAERHGLYQKLMAAARQALSPNEYQQFYMLF